MKQETYKENGYTNYDCPFHPSQNNGNPCEPDEDGCRDCVHNWEEEEE